MFNNTLDLETTLNSLKSKTTFSTMFEDVLKDGTKVEVHLMFNFNKKDKNVPDAYLLTPPDKNTIALIFPNGDILTTNFFFDFDYEGIDMMGIYDISVKKASDKFFRKSRDIAKDKITVKSYLEEEVKILEQIKVALA